jgi:hypothetical protein
LPQIFGNYTISLISSFRKLKVSDYLRQIFFLNFSICCVAWKKFSSFNSSSSSSTTQIFLYFLIYRILLRFLNNILQWWNFKNENFSQEINFFGKKNIFFNNLKTVEIAFNYHIFFLFCYHRWDRPASRKIRQCEVEKNETFQDKIFVFFHFSSFNNEWVERHFLHFHKQDELVSGLLLPSQRRRATCQVSTT